MYYIISLVAFVLIYVIIVLLMKKIRNTAVANTIFVAVTLFCYGSLAIIIYQDVGFYDWNFQNVLPTANVSPFMFATLIIYCVLPQKAKKAWALLISLLSFGMLCSAILGCVHRAVIHYKFHLTFLLDYIAHISLSLYGVYLVKSKQVENNKNNSLISGGLIIIVAIVMMIINVFAGTAFFGLALNEKYSIYNMVLVPNCYFSALLYFVGLIIVLISGYFYLKLLNRSQKD